jgi:hypothetical protein
VPKPTTKKGKTAKPATEPRLGIFWLVNGKLLIESAPLSECEKYGEHLNFPGSHIEVWEKWKHAGKAPADTEYEEYGRGRVLCDKQGTKFALLADTHILSQKRLIATIKAELHLPKQTSLGTDPHYRCFQCLHGNADDEE